MYFLIQASVCQTRFNGSSSDPSTCSSHLVDHHSWHSCCGWDCAVGLGRHQTACPHHAGTAAGFATYYASRMANGSGIFHLLQTRQASGTATWR